MSGLFTPKIKTKTPAAAPTPKIPELAQRELGGEEAQRIESRRKQRGRNALRIDPQTGGITGANGQGINIPMK